jgi:hypothetical protein
MQRTTESSRGFVAALIGAVLTCGAGAASGQAPGPATHAAAPRAEAVMVRGAITIDGRLDEAEWRSAAPATEFRQVDPDEGHAVSERTEVRIVYDTDAIYVGAWLADSRPVSSRLLRRDAFVLDSDWFSV